MVKQPLSLYIHLPWCVQKCPYCDFNSHAIREEGLPEQAYVDALIRDLQFEVSLFPDRDVSSVFFGGGTPSLFSGESINQILEAVRLETRLDEKAEITLEANPGTAEADHFLAYRQAGVNRLSMGVQSFADDKLSALGRIHNGEEAQLAFQMARDAGFGNINLDLMFGLPEQTKDQALTDLEIAVNLSPEHLSWYELTLEPNTAFFQQPPSLPSEQHIIEMHQQGIEYLSDQGFQRYEISAYAKENKHCRHNMNYWQFGDYMGIGAGAHGKLTDPQTMVIHRRSRCRHPRSYFQHAGMATAVSDECIRDRNQVTTEFMMNAMRLTHGFKLTMFEDITGQKIGAIQDILDDLHGQGLIDVSATQIKPTAKGVIFLNTILMAFLYT